MAARFNPYGQYSTRRRRSRRDDELRVVIDKFDEIKCVLIHMILDKRIIGKSNIDESQV